MVQVSSQTLMASEKTNNDIYDMIFQNVARSGTMFQQTDELELDVGVMETKDGIKVYSFHDPQWYAKMAYEMADATPKKVAVPCSAVVPFAPAAPVPAAPVPAASHNVVMLPLVWIVPVARY